MESAMMLPTHFHKEQTFTEFRVFHHIFALKSKIDVFKLSGGENLKLFRSKKVFFIRVATVCKISSQLVQGHSQDDGMTSEEGWNNAVKHFALYV